eukprot:gnl/MRDRNA2_/MRDRNA2_81506_c0_seq1.p1 gnl/MRDRNA2_/MRDRNA2_81506_c0~~gnl/MRDRNA2_/MRDRNA2_81506_c0_seq1.p1  ORF type:complete len:301 (+),score=42.60 gnl/MRDRNA2_/MRDRNA2_81506_c0_seq1:245-1147(+)
MQGQYGGYRPPMQGGGMQQMGQRPMYGSAGMQQGMNGMRPGMGGMGQGMRPGMQGGMRPGMGGGMGGMGAGGRPRPMGGGGGGPPKREMDSLLEEMKAKQRIQEERKELHSRALHQLQTTNQSGGGGGGSFGGGFGGVKDVDSVSTCLQVSELAPSVNEDQLVQIFARFGLVTSVKVVKSPMGVSGYVLFSTREQAERAALTLAGTDMHGRKLKIEFARNELADTSSGFSLPHQVLKYPPENSPTSADVPLPAPFPASPTSLAPSGQKMQVLCEYYTDHPREKRPCTPEEMLLQRKAQGA